MGPDSPVCNLCTGESDPLLMRRQYQVIISCEHGGNRVPPEFRDLFRGRTAVLKSHRAYDPGALELARLLAARLKAGFYYSLTTRLLVDLNRSLHHRQLFSDFTRGCDRKVKDAILAGYYHPYRNKLEQLIDNYIQMGNSVIHFSIHSFTPRLQGEIRRADVGLLYHPQRQRERALCHALQAALRTREHKLVTRMNYPYRGSADGLTTYLRKKHHGDAYLGVEIEINQKIVMHERKLWRRTQQQVAAAVVRTIRC